MCRRDGSSVYKTPLQRRNVHIQILFIRVQIKKKQTETVTAHVSVSVSRKYIDINLIEYESRRQKQQQLVSHLFAKSPKFPQHKFDSRLQPNSAEKQTSRK